MRIGYFVSQYPRSDEPPGYIWGGVGEAAAGLAEAMARLGHEVTVLTSSPHRRMSSRHQNGVTVIEVSSWCMISQAKIAPSLLWTGLRLDFDIVHAHAGNPPAPFGALIYHLAKGVPLVATCHGDPDASHGDVLRRMAVRLYQGHPLRYLFRRADVLYVPSMGFLDESHLLPTIQRSLEELPNGIAFRGRPGEPARLEARRRLGIPTGADVVLFLGHLNPWKGPDILLEAAALLQRRHPMAVILFLGDGMLREPLMRRARTLELQGTVRFEGFVAGPRKNAYFAAADVLALPSLSEVFPLVVLEAFAYGIPVVASDLQTFRRFLIDGENGVVTPRGDPAALCEALITILRDDRFRHSLGEGALATARGFDWMDIAHKAEEKYIELVKA